MNAKTGMAEEQQTVKVRVLFFGAARDATGKQEVQISLRRPATAKAAFDQLLMTFPDLQRFGRSLLLAINYEYAATDAEVQDGDELALFPPVSGGALEYAKRTGRESKDFFELTTQPIDVGEIARRVVLPDCGATVTLDGYAREWTKGRRTLHLIYEAYPPMALTEMERLGQQAHRQFEIAHIGIVHRTGQLNIGETSVVIAVSAAHREAAFAACKWAISELKQTVPIWKKEIFQDGEAWVEGSSPSNDDH